MPLVAGGLRLHTPFESADTPRGQRCVGAKGVRNDASAIEANEADRRTRLIDCPIPVLALLLTMFVPRNLEFHAGVALTPQRIVLLVMLPIALFKLFRETAGKLRAFDYLFIGAFVYFWLSLFPKETLEKALQSGSSQFLEAVGGYVVARAYIRSAMQFKAAVSVLFLACLAVGVAAGIEAINHVHWLKELAVKLGGERFDWLVDTRMGLMRASANFDHPIHYGAFCAATFALVWFAENRIAMRITKGILIATAAVFSMSSSALIAIVLLVAAGILEALSRKVPHRVLLLVAVGTFAYVVLAIVANRSIVQILSTSLTLDPWTAYYRLAIWEYGSQNVLAHPWIGLPLGGYWERPDWMYSGTVDHYWLVLAMSAGLPCVSLYLLSIGMMLRSVFVLRQIEDDPTHQACRLSWAAAVAMFCFIGTTVHLWREIEVMFTFVLGAGGWMAGGVGVGRQVVSRVSLAGPPRSADMAVAAKGGLRRTDRRPH